MMNAMGRTVNKLIDLDIDEVSLVDRGANQHSLVAFSKSLATEADTNLEESMSADVAVFSETGEAVDVEALEHGDTVFDADGNEYVFVADGEEEVEVEAEVEVEEPEVEKALRFGNPLGAMKTAYGREMAQTGSRGRAAKRAAKSGYKNANGTALVGGAALGAGAAGGAAALSKSLSEEILEEFSKAITDKDREAVIAKAMEQVEAAQEEARIAKEWAAAEHDARMTEAFISKAAEYNLPVSPEVFGPILKSLAESLTDEQLDVLDEVFTAVGDTLYNEIGYVGGGSNNSVLDQVNAFAGELVGKSDLSREQAMASMFESDPSLYDAYISEMGR